MHIEICFCLLLHVYTFLWGSTDLVIFKGILYLEACGSLSMLYAVMPCRRRSKDRKKRKGKERKGKERKQAKMILEKEKPLKVHHQLVEK